MQNKKSVYLDNIKTYNFNALRMNYEREIFTLAKQIHSFSLMQTGSEINK